MNKSLEKKLNSCEIEAKLSIWLEYIQYVQEEIDQENKTEQDLLKAIEKCCFSLEKEQHYKNDKTYLRLWITYADMMNQDVSIFERLKRNQIGQNLALFYEAWSTVLESNNDLEGALKVLEEGNNVKTTPEGHLEEFLKSFKERYPAIGVLPTSLAGYDRKEVYPNENEEFSFEEIRSRNKKYEIKKVVEIVQENKIKNKEIKEITIHTKEAQSEILKMFGEPLETDDNFFEIKKKKRKFEKEEKIEPKVEAKIEVKPKKNEKKIEIFEDTNEEEPTQKRKKEENWIVEMTRFSTFMDCKKLSRIEEKGKFILKEDVFIILSLLQKDQYSMTYLIQDHKSNILTLRKQMPPCPWEYYIMNIIQKKSKVIPIKLYQYFLYSNEGFLIEKRNDHGNLMNLILTYKKQNKLMDEHISIYYSIELLKMIESLHHECNLVFNSILPENISILNENTNQWDSWTKEGSKGWETKGILFNNFRNVKEKENENDIQIDRNGICQVMYWMLNGEEMEIEKSSDGSIQLKSSFKRYHQVDLWTNVFDLLLNSKESLSNIRTLLEDYLFNNPKKSSLLKNLVAKQNLLLKSSLDEFLTN